MTKIVCFIKEHKYFFLLTAAVLLVYVVPMFFMSLPKGHDIYYHMNRLRSLAQEISAGNLSPRIYNAIYNGYGYASPMFYGDWLMFLPALLICAGAEVVTAYTFYLLMCAMLTAWSMYFCAKYMFKSKLAAFVTACLYVFSSYFFNDLLYRHACGEMQSFIFLPIVVAGLYSILFRDGKRWYLLGLGLCGVLVSHLLTSVATVVVLVIICLIYIDKFIKYPKKLLYVLGSAALFFAASATFLFPIVEQLSTTSFISTDGTSANAFGSLSERSMPNLLSLFVSFNTSLGYDPYIPNGVGLASVVALVWRIVLRKHLKDKVSNIFLLMGILCLFATSVFFPWDLLQNIAGGMQFPWRLMIFATLFLCLFCGSVVPAAEERDFTVNPFLCSLAVFCVFSLASSVIPKYSSYIKDRIQGKVIDYPYEYNIGVGEYLPSGTNRGSLMSRAKKGDIAVSSNSLSSLEVERLNGYTTVAFTGNAYSGTEIELPLLMYVGYEGVLIDENGVETPLELAYGKDNAVKVTLPDGAESGVVMVWYAGTAVQKVSYIISLLTFAVLIGLLAAAVIRSKRQPKPCEISSDTVQKE